jgi:hypothetical protein
MPFREVQFHAQGIPSGCGPKYRNRDAVHGMDLARRLASLDFPARSRSTVVNSTAPNKAAK